MFAASPLRLATVLELGALTEGSTYAFRLTAFARGFGSDDGVAPVTAYAEVTSDGMWCGRSTVALKNTPQQCRHTYVLFQGWLLFCIA